ncbi:hypothetical protein E3983_00755 [Legionella israelensis]|uniref:Chalcone/stilbene synthase C-terminal domain-containing protein n=1 Tax=Legionella israelensis TaxID=454 RepID=A0AAX1ED10_9GAMM|nr:hypothetical protein [Legionella israelensis]QBR83011.1 hypothetical protein E3983_00755 [Legionella israelensis]
MMIEKIECHYPGRSYSNEELGQILYNKDKELSDVLVNLGGKHFLDEIKSSPQFFENLGVERRNILCDPTDVMGWWEKNAGTDPFALEAAKSYEQLMQNEPPLTTEDRIIVIANSVDTVSPHIGYAMLAHLQKRNEGFVMPSVIALLGEGCSGFISGLREAHIYIQAKPNARVVVVTAEMMATPLLNPWAQPKLVKHVKNASEEDKDMFRRRLTGLCIQRYLFGEGCAAALCANEGKGIHFTHYFRWANLDPDDINLLELAATNTKKPPHLPPFGFFSQQPKKLINRLAESYFPAAQVELAKINLDEHFFAIHTGSGKILNQVQTALQLSEEKIAPSKYILNNYGNMNATTGAAILAKLLSEKKNRNIVAIFFGLGFALQLAY